MEKNSLSQGAVTENFTGIGPVTRAQVHNRARELAVIAGRVPPQVSQTDYEQAKRELTGKSDLDQQEIALDLIPESRRWDPVPGSEGHQTPEAPDEDADDEGRNASAQLVAEGVSEASHDQMLQAARATGAAKSARREP